MAGSKFAYVKTFELPDNLLPNTFLIVRLDGHAFHRFSDTHGFVKPNDERALQLMDHSARMVMEEYKDVVLAFGESDEFSFLLRKSCTLYNRRSSKIITTLTSLFTASYVMLWPRYFPSTPLHYAPSFDGRLVMYPGEKEVKDYFAWRQVDTHINNLYNTVFWALVQDKGQTAAQAHESLRGTVSSTKHELLFNAFGINYNDLPARFRKGSVLVHVEMPSPVIVEVLEAEGMPPTAGSTDEAVPQSSLSVVSKHSKKTRVTYEISTLHCDIIKDDFWSEHPKILT
ncbi:tRNAHis guanylyltransferase [Gautieria morchelliformis]|nr:tRNAHis guanylyltransferase [Gautieria morchelliformis]